MMPIIIIIIITIIIIIGIHIDGVLTTFQITTRNVPQHASRVTSIWVQMLNVALTSTNGHFE
jgi:hypothetical protein